MKSKIPKILVIALCILLTGCVNLLVPVPFGKEVIMQVKSVVPCESDPRSLAQINRSMDASLGISDEQCKSLMFYNLSDLPLTMGGRMVTLAYLLTKVLAPAGVADPGDIVKVAIADYTPDRTLLAGSNRIVSVVCKAEDKECVDSTTLGTIK